ncbi:unnamed protein product [Boreogadus saida]
MTPGDALKQSIATLHRPGALHWDRAPGGDDQPSLTDTGRIRDGGRGFKSVLPPQALDDSSLALPAEHSLLSPARLHSVDRSVRVQQQVQLTPARKGKKSASNGSAWRLQNLLLSHSLDVEELTGEVTTEPPSGGTVKKE